MITAKIKNALSHYSAKSGTAELIYYYIKYSTAKFIGMILNEENYAKWFYHLYTGKRLNLNDPKYFDEKLWWLKLNNKDPNLTKCSDKVVVRDYVKDCGLADILVPLYDVFVDVNKLDFTKYNEEIIVKCSHNSGGHIFYDPSKPTDKENLKLAKKRLSFVLRKNASVLSREWNYKDIPPRIIVEKVIRDQKGKLPLDYKFMCFDGEPRLLFLDLGVIKPDKTYNHGYPRNIYDMDFKLLPVYESRPNAPYSVEKPNNFDRMVEIARKLSQPFPHCRVDLYNIDGKVYFGEITFYHGGGCNKITPEEWDFKMGEWINIHSDKIVR